MPKDEFIQDCFIAALHLIANLNDINDASYLYIPYLGFDFFQKSDEKEFGNRIVNRWEGTIDGGNHFLLNKNTFLEIKPQPDYTLAQCKETLKNGKHLMIWSDVYHCPWTMFYHKESFRHVYVITDAEKDHFLCQDVFFGIADYSYAAAKLYDHFTRVNLVELSKKDMDLRYMKEKMYFYLMKYEQSIQYAYDDFRNGLLELDISTQHVVGSNYYGNITLTKIKNLARYRMGYALFLHQLAADFQIDLSLVIRELRQLGSLWTRLVMILLRLFVKNKPIAGSDGKLFDPVMTEIAVMERQTLDRLLEFCSYD